MKTGGVGIDLFALFLPPFFAFITAFALATFSPLGKLPGWRRFFLLACVSSIVAAAVFMTLSLAGNISPGVRTFDLIVGFFAGALASLTRFWSGEQLIDKRQDERVHKQDFGGL